MTYDEAACFLQDLILKKTDPLADDVSAKLAILHAKFKAAQDAGMLDLIWRAHERVQEAMDRAYLFGMLNGTVDLLSLSVFPKMEPMFNRYPEGTPMYALLEEASIAFGDAAERYSTWAMAGLVIDEARRGWTEE